MKITTEDAQYLKTNAESLLRRDDGAWVYSLKKGSVLEALTFDKESGWFYHKTGPCASIPELMDCYAAAEQEAVSALSEIEGLTVSKTGRFYDQVLVDALFNGQEIGLTYYPNGKWEVAHHRAKREVQKPTKEVITEVIADWVKMDHNPGPFFEDQFPYTDKD